LAIYPLSDPIDTGPYCIDLWRYLKTELFNCWKERTRAPLNYKDKYFCYESKSDYLPQPYHFSHFKKVSAKGIANNLGKMI